MHRKKHRVIIKDNKLEASRNQEIINKDENNGDTMIIMIVIVIRIIMAIVRIWGGEYLMIVITVTIGHYKYYKQQSGLLPSPQIHKHSTLDKDRSNIW